MLDQNTSAQLKTLLERLEGPIELVATLKQTVLSIYRFSLVSTYRMNSYSFGDVSNVRSKYFSSIKNTT